MNYPVELFADENGVYKILVTEQNKQKQYVSSILRGIDKSFSIISTHEAAKVIILESCAAVYTEDTDTEAEKVMEELIAKLSGSPVPIISVIKENTGRLGYLMGLAADFVFISKTSKYINKEYARAGFRTKISEKNIDKYALDLANQIATGVPQAIKELTKHLPRATGISAVNASWPGWQNYADINVIDNKRELQFVRVENESEAMEWQASENGILVAKMCERESKNSFSDKFIKGIIELFAHIKNNKKYKVIILTGFESYFACGGTKEELLKIQQRKAKFTDFNFYSAALECDVPVIAAMQGHGIGAGWAFGMFCDHIILSIESIYAANFMQYGFTPGAGSTLIFPHRFGCDLGKEILFTARQYHGEELKARGINYPVLPRAEVMGHALELANKLCLYPREELVARKNLVNAELRAMLAETYAKEQAMQDKTFAGSEEVLKRIENHFYEGLEKIFFQKHVSFPPEVLPPAALPSNETLQKELLQSLSKALYIKTSDIERNKKFIEMGMDSIIGVEWIKSINSRYGTSFSATAIYDYPTVAEFTGFLRQNLGQQTPGLKVSDANENLPKAFPRLRRYSTQSMQKIRLKAALKFQHETSMHYKGLYFYSADYEGDFERDGKISIFYKINPETNVCLKEHLIFNEYVFPTDAYLELIYVCAKAYFNMASVCIKDIALLNPLVGIAKQDCYVRIEFKNKDGYLQFGVQSGAGGRQGNELIHIRGFIMPAHKLQSMGGRYSPNSRLEVEKEINEEELIFIRQNKIAVGAFYKGLKKIDCGKSNAVARIEIEKLNPQFLLNPSVVNGGLACVMTYGPYLLEKQFTAGEDIFLPSRMDNLLILRELSTLVYYCYTEVKTVKKDSIELYFEIADENYQTCLIVENIRLQRVTKDTIQKAILNMKSVCYDLRIRNPEPDTDVAIIGMSCRYPMSKDIGEFWINLKNGVDCITEVPINRWSDFMDWYHPDPKHKHTSYSKQGGFLDDVYKFDAKFFNISPLEAGVMDPQQRIFLEEAWKAIENAGYAPSALNGQSCGVYVGNAAGDYQRILAKRSRDTVGLSFMGTSTAILAARIAYFLNLKGPAISVDTACSSSLTAMHLACESIRHGDNKLAIAGGVNLYLTPLAHILTSQVGMQSKDGKCFTFDQAANGTVFSEGCGVVLLKSLAMARRDGDTILGIIRGSGINQDGKTNGITAPSTLAQEELISAVYTKFRINPDNISYVEAHGTGTPLGDTIEIEALTRAFHKFTARNHYCAIGSVKTNIGHGGFAAGIAGVIKVLLCLKHKKYVPTLNFQHPNQHINFGESPFFVNTEFRNWDIKERTTSVRMAAVSSFGFSGTNAHVVIEEYAADQNTGKRTITIDKQHTAIIVLSAKSREQVKQQARNLWKDIEATGYADGDLPNIAYTLQAGRDGMEERLGLIVSSLAELKAKLQRYGAGDEKLEEVYVGQVKRNSDALSIFKTDEEMQETIKKWIAAGENGKLVDVWVNGWEVDWNLLYEKKDPVRISLPTYPFAGERYWPDAKNPESGTEHAGIMKLNLLADKDFNESLVSIIGKLKDSFESIASRSDVNVILLEGLEESDKTFFADAEETGRNEQQINALCDTLWESPVPVVCVIKGNGRGLGYLIGLAGDFLVLNAEGHYANDRILKQSSMYREMISRKYGHRLLEANKTFTGRELTGENTGLHIVPTNQITEYGTHLANRITHGTPLAVRELKRQMQNKLRQEIAAGGISGQTSNMEWESYAVKAATDDTGAVLTGDHLNFKCVEIGAETMELEASGNGILVVRMCERESKNTFSDRFIRDLATLKTHLTSNKEYKVMILTGYDNYYACGGTKEELLKIQGGKIKFSDFKVFSLALECEIPVIGAMQGHAIGAGWAFGMFCDYVIFSMESGYAANFMEYGFTPGAGATLIFPARFGYSTGWEFLFTAKQYSGSELKVRGIQYPILPRQEVLDFALNMAGKLCLYSRVELIAKKNRINGELRAALEETYAQEQAMHEKTFAGNAEVLKRIEAHFNQGMEMGMSVRKDEGEAKMMSCENRITESKAKDADELLEKIKKRVKRILSAELYLIEMQIEEDEKFIDMGMDSITGVTFVGKINEEYDLELAATQIYSHPTISDLSVFILNESEKLHSLSAEQVDAVVQTPESILQNDFSNSSIPCPEYNQKKSIAIIGMSGKFPMAGDVTEFWENIATGRNCISEIPKDRWDVNRYMADSPYGKWQGVLEDAAEFDPQFFNISPGEAEVMDPQQRIFLESAWRCIEDAGYSPQSLAGSKCGVYVGCAANDYERFKSNSSLDARDLIGKATSVLASRIAYILDWQGPCLSIDTACSSSLVAIAEACNSLAWGESNAVLAAGVCVLPGPGIHIMTGKAGMLSADGRCYTFDNRANGFVPGEGVGVLFLKRLEDAKRDRDHIYGTIKGWGVNQDGKTNGITAPNGESQARLETGIYEKFGINPESITLVEAHGTGTKLGDPIEVEALIKAFEKFTTKRNFCALGSVKSNIGHLLAAAGAAGVIKVLLSLQHRQLPATINYENLNEHIRLKESPFYINTELKSWNMEQGEKRRAAISSFGFSGTNAHIIIEEYNRSTPPMSKRNPVVIVLSAKNREQLKQQAGNLYTVIDGNTYTDNDLPSIGYTLQVGRDAMEVRLGVIVCSLLELKEKLQRYCADDENIEEMYTGTGTSQVKKNKEILYAFKADEELQEAIHKWIKKGKYRKLTDLWVKGLEVDWNLFYAVEKPERISLPTYPFARERYWSPANRFTGYFSGKEFFQKDYALHGETETLFYEPVWNEKEIEAGRDLNYAEHIVFLCGVDKPEIEAAGISYLQLDSGKYAEDAVSVFDAVKNTMLSKPECDVLIQVLIDNGSGTEIYRGLAGLLKTARLENPKIKAQVIGIDKGVNIGQVVHENGQAPDDEEIRYDGNHRRYVINFQEIEIAQNQVKIPWKEEGVYLITGGMGGLGLIFAKEIGRKSKQAKVILTGHSPLTEEKHKRMQELEAMELKAEYRAVDVTDKRGVEELIEDIVRKYGRLDGIIHSAGIIKDNYLVKKSRGEFREVLSVKAEGLLNLDAATKDLKLDFMVFFSSLAVNGNPGQADYACANAFMDRYAEYRDELVRRNQRSGKTLSVNWPIWAGGGMRIDAALSEMIYRKWGMIPLETDKGINAFYRSYSVNKAVVMVLEGARDRLQRYVLKSGAEKSITGSNATGMKTDEKILETKTIKQLKILFSEVTKHKVNQIDEEEVLATYGIDSIMITKLNEKLDEIFGELSKTLLFEYKTIKELGKYLTRMHGIECLAWTGLTADEESNMENGIFHSDRQALGIPALKALQFGGKENNGNATEPIAVIGVSGRYPQAKNPEELWDNLKSGKDCISEIPLERWSLEGFYEADEEKAIREGKSYSKWGGFLEGFDEFDPLFFNVSPREALNMDPQERIFLESCWEVMEDAGYTRETIRKKVKGEVGVFAGITKTGYELYGPGLWQLGVQVFPHTSFGSIANRVSYILDLRGPSMPVDTMCSSSLTAIHEACEHLQRGECQMAIAGGVNLYLHPSTYTVLCSSRMLSIDGRCRSFGKEGKGFVAGEGVGAVLLKPLAQAIQDKDNIYGIIKASSVNHGGKTNGYTVPNPNAQGELIRKSLEKAGIKARRIGYVEAHGTGTVLGDPIEISGLIQAFAQDTTEKQFCSLGSVKSNIGHLEAAAGIAGLTKVLLQLKHKMLVPSLHCGVLNPHIDFENSPFIVNRELREWVRPRIKEDGEEREYPRTATVSAFGAGGSNAHLVIEEYIPVHETTLQPMKVNKQYPVAIVLSAKSREQVKVLAENLRETISRNTHTDSDLQNIAYTLQTGREAMEERLGLIVSSPEELKEKLYRYGKGMDAVEELFEGQVKRNKEVLSIFKTEEELQNIIHVWIAKKQYGKLVDLWVKGLELDWNLLYAHEKPEKISLPVYPFLKEKYWIEELKRSGVPGRVSDPRFIHPLLHQNTSTLAVQRFTSMFNGDTLQGQKTIPGTAFLEMARAALETALEINGESVLLEDIAWVQPFPVNDESKKINIALYPGENETIAYEIYGEDKLQEQAILYNRGRGCILKKGWEERIEIERLITQYNKNLIPTAACCAAFDKMGIAHGKSREVIKELYRGEDRVLARLEQPDKASESGYLLHPTLLEAALFSAWGLMFDDAGGINVITPGFPFALERMEVTGRCSGQIWVTAKYAESGNAESKGIKFDLNLYDEAGKICVKLIGMEYQSPEMTGAVLPGHCIPEKIRLFDSAAEQVKSGGKVYLVENNSAVRLAATDMEKPKVSLNQKMGIDFEKHDANRELLVELYAYENGIMRIKITVGNIRSQLMQQALKGLNKGLDFIKGHAKAKVILLEGMEALFFPHPYPDNESQKLMEETISGILESSLPVITVMKENGKGAGYAIGLSGDFAVISEESRYHAGALSGKSKQYRMILDRKYGPEFFKTYKEYTGQEIKAQNMGIIVLTKNEIDGYVMSLASQIAKGLLPAIKELKKHLQYELLSEISSGRSEIKSACREWQDYTGKAVVTAKSKIINIDYLKYKEVGINSEIIKLKTSEHGILMVEMCECESKNKFSDRFIGSLLQVFEHIKNNKEYKVVILTGYDNYFACGGTKEELLKIHGGKVKFTDIKIFSMALEIKIPVISAMQGHGIGAGWSFGMFSDYTIFSEECSYMANFMEYGFTPGAGATLIFPHRFGYSLGWELLFTAGQYRGSDLRKKGIAYPVLPSRDVVRQALDMAGKLCLYEREELIKKKNSLCIELRARIEEIYRKEAAMHERTFVGNDEVLKRIEKYFNAGLAKETVKPGRNVQQENKPEPELVDRDILQSIKKSVKKVLAEELHLKEEQVDEDEKFIDMGMDSITGVTFIKKLNDEYGLEIAVTQVYNYPTIVDLSRYMLSEAEKLGLFLPTQQQKEIQASLSKPRIKFSIARSLTPGFKQKTGITETTSIAIIGMSGKFPLAGDLPAFWENLKAGRDCITEIPKERWDVNKYYDADPAREGKSNGKWQGVLEDAAVFDPLFFNISPREAEIMDPQQRIFLESAWQCIEDAGYSPQNMSGSRCGVYVGCGASCYGRETRNQYLNAQDLLGGATSILASRIAYVLNLQGPCLAIDTACSSSLVAISVACNSLLLGESDAALAGGVCVLSKPAIHIMTGKAGMLSADGRCFAFDNRANGFVPGEGVGVLFLKRLEDAKRDKDHIYGIIRGWGVNQDGKTNGITAPNGESQTRLETEVYEKYGINPESITFIEAHGTGTKLGDPIEVDALIKAFGKFTKKRNFCALGTVKSNIGHLLTAAGVAGVIKVLLAIKHKEIPATINYEKINEHIHIGETPFYINAELKAWETEEGVNRRAAVSSFGFSGTNAHIVIEEYIPEKADQDSMSTHPVMLVLSAKSREQVKKQASMLLENINANNYTEYDLRNIAYTLQVGRDAMEERLGLIVRSLQELREKLHRYGADDENIEELYAGRVKKNTETLEVFKADAELQEVVLKWVERRKYGKLVALWVKGLEIDWNLLYAEQKPVRISLPTYPFLRQQYWIDDEKKSGQGSVSRPAIPTGMPKEIPLYEDKEIN